MKQVLILMKNYQTDGLFTKPQANGHFYGSTSKDKNYRAKSATTNEMKATTMLQMMLFSIMSASEWLLKHMQGFKMNLHLSSLI